MKKYTLDELKRFSHDELMAMLEEREISWSEWVEAQPETYDGYAEWLEREGRTRCDDSAQLFIHEVESSMMDEETPSHVESVMEKVERYNRIKADAAEAHDDLSR